MPPPPKWGGETSFPYALSLFFVPLARRSLSCGIKSFGFLLTCPQDLPSNCPSPNPHLSRETILISLSADSSLQLLHPSAFGEREREASTMGDANAPVGGGEAGWNTDDERKKVALMRACVEKQDPAAKDVDDQTLKRFLRARDLDIKKASSLFLKYLKWRRTQVPKGFISEEEVQNELSQNKLFMQGFDKKGRPIGVVMGGRHDYSKRNIDEFRRVVVYGLDKICSRMPAGQEKFIFIGDIQGWSYSNCDMRAYLAALDIMQFVFVDDKNLKETLLEDIDESQVPDIYGGRLPLVRVQDLGK